MKKLAANNGWIKVLKKSAFLEFIIVACVLTACSERKEILTTTSDSSEATSVEGSASQNNREIIETSEETTSLAEETNTPSDRTKGDYDGSIGPLTYSGSVENGFTVYQYDIELGNKKEVFSFKNNNFYTTAVGYNDAFNTGAASNFQSKGFFSEDMTKFAISWTDNKDSSQRVGWVNKDGELTDVTKVISPTSTEFSSRIPKDHYPQFTPDGSFMFVDGNTKEYVYVDINTLEVINREKIEDNLWSVMILPNGKKTKRVFGDSGVYADVDFGDYHVQLDSNKYGPPSFDSIVGCDFTDAGVVIGIGYKEDHDANIKRNCIAKYGPGFTQPKEYNGTPKRYEPDSYVELTPTTDYNLESCAYNNGRIAFIGNRTAGGDRYLFMIDDGDGEQPVKQVAAVPWGEMLLFWR